MKTNWMYGCMSILMAATALTSCSSSDDNETPTPQPTGYNWTTDGGLKAADGILFTSGTEDPNGKEIGNGNQEFVFTGKQTINDIHSRYTWRR